MLALILWAVLGWRVACGELLVELAACAFVLGGGRGRRIGASLRSITKHKPRSRLHPSGV